MRGQAKAVGGGVEPPRRS